MGVKATGVKATVYVAGRVVHDADAHIVEPPTWLRDHAAPARRDRVEPLRLSGGNELQQTGDPAEQLRDPEAEEIMLPSWMRQMESAFDAFARHEERLRALSLRPSEVVRRRFYCDNFLDLMGTAAADLAA